MSSSPEAGPKRPDFNSGFFSLNRLKPLLQNEGVVLLRKVLPPGLLQQWQPVFWQAWQQTEARFLAGEMPETELLNYYRFGHPLPMFIEGFDSWLAALFGHLPLRNLLRSLYGPQVQIMGSFSLPRIQEPELKERALPYHQDYEYIGPVEQAVNVWIPLTPAGGDYPGLEFWVGNPQKPLLVHGQPESERQQVLDQAPPEAWWQPQLKAGDILIFSPYTIHRSHLTEQMTQTRISYELRLCPESDRPHTLSSLHLRHL